MKDLRNVVIRKLNKNAYDDLEPENFDSPEEVTYMMGGLAAIIADDIDYRDYLPLYSDYYEDTDYKTMEEKNKYYIDTTLSSIRYRPIKDFDIMIMAMISLVDFDNDNINRYVQTYKLGMKDKDLQKAIKNKAERLAKYREKMTKIDLAGERND